jgi:hypothetical protein
MTRQTGERARVATMAVKVERATAARVQEMASAAGKTRSAFINDALVAAVADADGSREMIMSETPGAHRLRGPQATPPPGGVPSEKDHLRHDHHSPSQYGRTAPPGR